MTRIESKTAQVNKPASELYHQLLDFKNFNKVMPDRVTKFEAGEDSFLFAMKGMPEVEMRLEEAKEPELIRLRSGSKSKIDFALMAHIHPTSDNTCEVKFEFTGKFNPMLKMMVEKPLKNFIENLADKVQEL